MVRGYPRETAAENDSGSLWEHRRLEIELTLDDFEDGGLAGAWAPCEDDELWSVRGWAFHAGVRGLLELGAMCSARKGGGGLDGAATESSELFDELLSHRQARARRWNELVEVIEQGPYEGGMSTQRRDVDTGLVRAARFRAGSGLERTLRSVVGGTREAEAHGILVARPMPSPFLTKGRRRLPGTQVVRGGRTDCAFDGPSHRESPRGGGSGVGTKPAHEHA